MSSHNLNSAHLPDDSDRSDMEHVLYRVNHLLPEDQHLLTIPPTTRASDALRLMKQHGYSQLPILHENDVVGVFSHRSFADGVLDLAGERRLRAEDLPVIDFAEQLTYADVTQDIGEILTPLDRDGAVLVGNSERLLGIATPIDVLRYFYRVASAFLILQEIERGLRVLIKEALPGDELFEAMDRCRASAPERPVSDQARGIEDLSFGDYVQLIGNKDNWPRVQPLFGTSRELVLAKLKPINQLRNVAFHFRRDLTDADRERLGGVRSWLRIRLMLTRGSRQ